MEHYKETGKADPDYESYNSALELNEEEVKKANLNKLKKIIEDAYNNEIVQRQDQIEQIELQICKVRKLLHLLRYALIMSYYKKQELEYNGTEEEASTSDNLINPDKQNRIHPAIKKLLGKDINNLDHLNVKNKRKTITRLNQVKESVNDVPETKKIKLETTTETAQNSVNDNEKLDLMQNRKKTKFRIIVGNISKWMPSSEDDILTHKWMVYVRGPKEKPDVSHFIEKVVYYLHPSYKPHDVVEVSESPFHLSRRGWGEFPVRVQIFFKVTLNKPIDVVHFIKLDKKYTGRQTLGNETLVDVYLYNDANLRLEDLENSNSLDTKIDILNHDMMDFTTDAEHDYCEVGNTDLNLDHAYSLPSSHQGLPKPKNEKIDQDETNELIYGLENYLSDQNGDTNKKPNTLKLIQLNRKDIKFNNTKIIVFGKKMEGSFLTNFGKLVSSRDLITNRNEFKIVVPKANFKSMGEALPYLFKRLPLYTNLASNLNYKRMYPFMAGSLKEFVSWNVGKRRSSEWSRARMIKKILIEEKIYGVEKWNTKAILMYGRSHDYTPFTSYGLFNRISDEKTLLLSCYESNRLKNDFTLKSAEDNQDVTVNVESESESPKKQETIIDISDPFTRLECSYIRQTALTSGIILKQEEICEGVKVNGAEMMILEAVKCLANNLIRRAKNHKVCTRTLSSNTSAINKEDVEVALNERPELFCLHHVTR